MKRALKVIVILIPIIAVYVVTMLLLFDFEERQMSRAHDTIFAVVKSPDNQTIATVYDRDMGATTGFATLVSLHRSHALFAFDRDTILSITGRPKITLKWENKKTLLIICPEPRMYRGEVTEDRPGEDRAEVINYVKKWRDISIQLTTDSK